MRKQTKKMKEAKAFNLEIVDLLDEGLGDVEKQIASISVPDNDYDEGSIARLVEIAKSIREDFKWFRDFCNETCVIEDYDRHLAMMQLLNRERGYVSRVSSALWNAKRYVHPTKKRTALETAVGAMAMFDWSLIAAINEFAASTSSPELAAIKAQLETIYQPPAEDTNP